jgi:Phage late-transcription coactivator
MRIQFDSNNFISQINHMCTTKNIEYIDAVIMWCEKNSIELEFIANIIKKDPLIRSKIQSEAEGLNYIKPSGAKLPI